MFKRKLPRSLPTMLATAALSGFAMSATAQDAPLVSSADLPGVPVSITENQRTPTSAPIDEAATNKAQASAVQAMFKREKAIAEMQRQVEALQQGKGQSMRGLEATKEIADELEKQIRDNQATERQEVAVLTPGVNRIMKISRGHPNRITGIKMHITQKQTMPNLYMTPTFVIHTFYQQRAAWKSKAPPPCSRHP